MGFSISWVAVQGIERAVVLERLGLRETGEPDEYFETPFSGATSAGGWTLVVSNNCDHFRQPKLLAPLSEGARVIASCAEEHVMFSSAEEWRNGARVWLVEHAGEEGDPTNLTTHGNPPASLPSIRDAMMNEQGDQTDVDFGFEIPLLLSKEITGFKHDQSVDGYSLEKFAPMDQDKPTKKRGLFGWS